MKFLFTILFLIGVSPSVSSACSPPPDRYTVQGAELGALFRDANVDSKIREFAGRNDFVNSVLKTVDGYQVGLSNGCYFTAVVRWIPPTVNGMCPTLGPFEVEKESCK